VEFLGKVRDRGVCTSELLQNAAPRGVREGGERGVETGFLILNHTVQCLPRGFAARKAFLLIEPLRAHLSRVGELHQWDLDDSAGMVALPGALRAQKLLGHHDLRTTMIYTHVVNRGPLGVESPLDL